MPQAASTRWSPTPEQLMILEEMYRGGIRTPNAAQIQQITAHLSLYGKIEGKNVFYWFQNHKARDRQKNKRSLNRQQQQLQQNHLPLLEPSTFLPSYQNQINFLHQGGIEEATQMMSFPCTLETPQMIQMEKPNMKYGQDWMVMNLMMDTGPTTPCYRPLRTLELFPIKSTGLKEEKNVGNPFSACSTSTTN